MLISRTNGIIKHDPRIRRKTKCSKTMVSASSHFIIIAQTGGQTDFPSQQDIEASYTHTLPWYFSNLVAQRDG